MAALLAASLFVSCGAKDLTEDEVKEIVSPLIDKSYKINVIFFGEGLPGDESEAVEYDETQYDVKPVSYITVLSGEFKNIDQLKEAASEVYSSDYLGNVFKLAFEGMTDDKGEIYQYPRYIESYSGELKIIGGAKDESIVTGRTYDVSTLKITSQTSKYVFFTVESYIDGNDAGPVDLSIKLDEAGWRLDSPTY